MCKEFVYKKNLNKILKTKSNDLIILQNNVDKNNLLKTIIKTEVATLYCSLKYSKEQIADIILESESFLSINKINSLKLNADEYLLLAKAYKKIINYNLYITDKNSITLEELENICLKMKSEKNIKFVFIDNLLLLSKNSNKTNDELCTYLKQMALKLNISIFALSLDSENISKKE